MQQFMHGTDAAIHLFCGLRPLIQKDDTVTEQEPRNHSGDQQMKTTTQKLQKTSSSFFQWHSLRTRVTLLTLPIFVIGIGALTFYANYTLHRDMEKTLTTGTIAVGAGVAAAAVAATVAASSGTITASHHH